jgi:preprotein translocase subunit SecD
VVDLILIRNYFIGISIVILFTIICSCSHSKKSEDKNYLLLKDVIADQINLNDRYVSLGSMYKYVDYGGIQLNDIYIDKESGLSIPTDQIESCSIQDVLFHPKGLLVYQVSFKFDKKLSSILKKYFKPRVGKTVAILLDDETVFTVVDVREMLGIQFTATVFGRSKSQIKDELTKICRVK